MKFPANEELRCLCAAGWSTEKLDSCSKALGPCSRCTEEARRLLVTKNEMKWLRLPQKMNLRVVLKSLYKWSGPSRVWSGPVVSQCLIFQLSWITWTKRANLSRLRLCHLLRHIPYGAGLSVGVAGFNMLDFCVAKAIYYETWFAEVFLWEGLGFAPVPTDRNRSRFLSLWGASVW